QKTLLADAVTLTAPGIPMLLQGSEFLQEGAFNDWQALDWDLPEAHANFVLAHKHLIDLRTNLYGNTTGLTGQSTKILQLDNDNKLISYHRWDRGGPDDDVIVVANFGANTLRDYSFLAPRTGGWIVRFNSSWSGYGDDFPNLELESVEVDSDKKFTLEIPAYCLLIFSQNPKD
ncbi:MAG: alpha amylase C-terminal domain-containing protein, partial [Candidatus Saccharimonas sp.]